MGYGVLPETESEVAGTHIFLIHHEEVETIVRIPRENTLRGRRIPNTYTPAFELWNGTRISATFLFNETV